MLCSTLQDVRDYVWTLMQTIAHPNMVRSSVLRLASLTHQLGRTLEQQQLDELEDFEDKDPFDTSAYAHITKELEDDLECTVYNISWTNVSNGAVFTVYEYS